MTSTSRSQAGQPDQPHPFKLIRPRKAASTATAGKRGADTRATERLTFAPGDLAPDPPAPGTPDNLLLASVKDDDIIVAVPFDANSELELGDHVFLKVDGKDYNADGEWAEVEEYDNPIFVTLPATARVGDGPHAIQYRYQFVTGTGNFEDGPTQSFIVDTRAPGSPQLSAPDLQHNGDILFPPDLVDGALLGYIAGYTDLAPGDRVQLSIDGIDVGDTILVSRIPGPGEDIDISYPADAIGALEDGPHEFGYSVTDRAGNRSQPSKTTTLRVLIDGYVGELEAPLVPEARLPDDQDNDHSDLIDLADARSDGGVAVDIPAHEKYAERAFKYRLWWGSQISEPTDMPADGTISLVPYKTVADVWDPTGGNPDDARSVQVKYTVELDGTMVGTSPAVQVWVNLHSAGGIDPVPETPENENLAPPVVTSASGETDRIPVGDFNKDATIEAPGQTVDPSRSPVFVEGDVVTFHYGESALAPHTVTAAEAGAAISITVPAATIGAEGSGSIPAYYTIDRIASDQNDEEIVNRTQSPSKTVTVEGPSDLPGGGDPLPAVTWKEAGATGNAPDLIGPIDARNLVTLEIPAYINKKASDKIELTLPLFRRFVHADGETAIPGRTFTVTVPTKGVDEPTSVQFGESHLMYYHDSDLTMHAHVSYTVLGEGKDTAVGSDELILRVDSRGDRPTGP